MSAESPQYEFYLRSRGLTVGPYSLEEIRTRVAEEKITPVQEMSYDGRRWFRASRIWETIRPAPPRVSESAPDVDPSQREYYLRSRGLTIGPYGLEEIRSRVAQQKITPVHELSYDGAEWFRAGEIWETIRPPKSTPRISLEPSENPAVDRPPQVVFYLRSGGDAVGPYSLEQIQARVAQGKIKPVQALSNDGVRWFRASKVWDSIQPLRAAAAVEEPNPPSPEEALDSLPEILPEARPERLSDVPMFYLCSILYAALLALCCVVPLHAVVGTSSALMQADFDQVQSLEQVDDRLTSHGFSALSVVAPIVNVVLGILFLAWRTWAVAGLRGHSAREKTALALSALWFFVPVVNLWKPYQGLRQIWRLSEASATTNGGLPRSRRFIAAWQNAWIAVWVIGHVGVTYIFYLHYSWSGADRAAAREFTPKEIVSGVVKVGVVEIIFCVATSLLMLVTAALVVQIATLQRETTKVRA